jgi:hypothetical protein
MTQINNKRLVVFVTIFCAVLFCYSFTAHAAQSVRAITPELLQSVLYFAGIKAEIIHMGTADGFKKGVLISGLRGADVFIGFPEGGIQRERPFLLSIDGKESMVKLAKSGGLVNLGGADIFYEENDFQALSVAGCILQAVGNMVDEILNCRANVFCIIGAVFSGVGDIMGCL